jgi:hypothetical protein
MIAKLTEKCKKVYYLDSNLKEVGAMNFGPMRVSFCKITVVCLTEK